MPMFEEEIETDHKTLLTIATPEILENNSHIQPP